ncbi:TPA: hypothetical protein HA231_03080 [Candidatus Woesearchaeota archaeon]|nr:hypothetical protein [Candidatus Woesearchaeota archaeon]
MNTHTIIVPIDRKRSVQLLALLEMFSRNAVIPMKDIAAVIPKSTFFALLYKLKVIGRIVSERCSFDLFTFERTFDLEQKREVKLMKSNAKLEMAEVDGLVFAVFTKQA